MLYHISYHFYDENAPDESFFDMLDEISDGSVQLGFDGCLLIDVACEPKGLEAYFAPYFTHRLDRYIITPFVRGRSRCKVTEKEQKFLKTHWHKVPK